MAPPRRSRRIAGSASLSPPSAEVEPPPLARPALFDTGVWTWTRDRRFPQLASWFNAQVAAGSRRTGFCPTGRSHRLGRLPPVAQVDTVVCADGDWIKVEGLNCRIELLRP